MYLIMINPIGAVENKSSQNGTGMQSKTSNLDILYEKLKGGCLLLGFLAKTGLVGSLRRASLTFYKRN